jgi:hypothetical protein
MQSWLKYEANVPGDEKCDGKTHWAAFTRENCSSLYAGLDVFRFCSS